MRPKKKRFDLLIKNAGGKVHLADRGIFVSLDIGIRDGIVVALEPNLSVTDANQVYLLGPGFYVTIGVIDPHVHYARGVPWSLGMSPERNSLYAGSTMVVDAGSVGRNGFPHFYQDVIRRSSADGIPRVEMRAFINIIAGGLSNNHHECYSLEYANVAETVAVAREFRDAIVGVKVRLGWLQASPATWREALRRSRQAADLLGLPLMVHINEGPPIWEILGMLAPGDIVTHCYHGRGQEAGSTILTDSGRLRPCVITAMRRKVKMDLGHGQGGYSHLLACQAILDGMLSVDPEGLTISTDLHCFCVNGPTHNIGTTMTKALTWPGFDLQQLFRMVTWNAARMLRLPTNRATLRNGSPAELSIWQHLSVPRGYPLLDAQGHRWKAKEVIQAAKVVRAGVLI